MKRLPLNRNKCFDAWTGGARRKKLEHENLYMLMEVYETDANSLLAIDCTPDSLDSRLKRLPADKQDYLEKTFDFMIEQALKSA